MAIKKEYVKAVFSNARSRTIIVFTALLVIMMMAVGFYKLSGSTSSSSQSSGVLNAPSMQSIPGALNQTPQYAALQEKQNVAQAEAAAASGKSSIPTIISSQAFGSGVQSVVCAQDGQGSVGFSTLINEKLEGPQSTLWYQDLKDQQCSRDSLKKAVAQGATLNDLKSACTCEQLKENGYSLADLKPVCPCPELKAIGVSAMQFKKAGYTADELKICGFVACEERAAGFTADEMKNAGYSDGELAGAGFNEREIARAGGLPDGVSLDDVQKAGCSADSLKRLRASGVSAAAIRRISGCSTSALKVAGYTPQELRKAGFSAAELKAAGFTPEQLRQAGYSGRELLDAGFSPDELTAAGFSQADIAAAEALLPLGITADMVKKTGCDVEALKRQRLAGVSALMIKKLAGCSAAGLKAAGFSDSDLARAGFTPSEINTPLSVDASGLPDKDIKAAGCDPAALKVLHDKGVSAKRIHELNGCSADALRKTGYGLEQIAAAGFTPAQLLAAGFTPQELSAANLGMKPAGVYAAGRNAECSAASLQAAQAMGVSAAEIRHSLGCSVAAMKAVGYTAAQLKDAGYSAAELKVAGYSPAELKAAGFSAKELRAAGFSAADLKAVGFDAKALKDAGFSATDLKVAGFLASDLKAVGFSPKELAAAGFSAADLKKAGVTAKELKDAGFSGAQLKAAGFSSDDLSAAGFSSSDSALADLNKLPISTVNPDKLPPIVSSADAAANSQAANAKKLETIMAAQKVQMADQRYQQKIQQRTSQILAAANQALQGWKAAPQQTYAKSKDKEDAAGADKSAGNTPPGGLIVNPGQLSPQGVGGALGLSVKMGDIIFAVIDTSINSDEPGPILASVVSGPLKGSKLIGSFNLPSNSDKMVITFNSLSMPGAPKTISIAAFAIDPNTARTALSSETDHHYLSRYGALFASTFLEGFGNAFQSADTTVTIGGTGGTTDTTVQNGIGRSALENAVIGLANVGKAWGQVAQQNMSRPTTVQVFAGTGVGILFTQDVTI